MKRNIIASVALGAALFGLTAMAQTPAARQCGNSCANTECTAKADCSKEVCKKADCKKNGCLKAAAGKAKLEGRKARGERPDRFKGITLTADQQAKIQALDQKRAENARGRATAERDAKRAQKLNRDSLRQAEQVVYMQEVKEILTPDQYVVFLENATVDAPVRGGAVKAKEMKAGKAMRASKAARQQKKAEARKAE